MKAISMLLDPAPRIELEPLQPYLRITRFEQAQLKITDPTTQLPFARHTHVFTKLATQSCHGEIKPCGSQNKGKLVRQA